MTDQPTTWTPERALAMLRDLSNDAIEGPAFLAKWGSEFDPEQVAMAALESAAAEIERQKARADAAEKEVERLQGIIDDTESESGLAGLQFDEGCEPPSLPDFVRHIVEERVAYGEEADALSREVERLRAELAAKQPATPAPFAEINTGTPDTLDVYLVPMTTDQLNGRALDEAAARAMEATNGK